MINETFKLNSEPILSKFNPMIIPMQRDVMQDIRCNFDYSMGVHEILLSGSIGSSKSCLMAHIAVTHCLFNPGARLLVGRRSMPDLKRTFVKEIIDHIAEDLRLGVDYIRSMVSGDITFSNGSQIICYSWADGNYTKVRSLNLSAAIIEELIETDSMDHYFEIKMRVGRLKSINENFIVSATNPGSPASEAYKYFIEKEPDFPTRHVYYSITEDNPFLPKKYIEQLKQDLDPMLARRMLKGEWIDLSEDVIYYAYSTRRNFLHTDYQIEPHHPIGISWDFNIGFQKPMSVVLFQFIDDQFHFFDEVIIFGGRTLDTCEELQAKGYLDQGYTFYLFGDQTGAAKDTRSVKSDWDIIKRFFNNYAGQTGRVEYKFCVPSQNPSVRERHNVVNAYCQNAKKQCRLFVYKKAKTLDEGLRLTSFKKGASFQEDDSKAYQHSTTALGYAVHYTHKNFVLNQRSKITQSIIR